MPPKIPLGKPLQLTDEELDAMAEITPEDIEKTKKLWRKVAPDKYKDLLDATPVEDNG